MGTNNGKYFDLPATNTFFSDISSETNKFARYSKSHFQDLESVVTEDTWQGEDADIAKLLLTSTETQLLRDIIQLHKDIEAVEESIIYTFRKTVDDDSFAYLNYDDLEGINNFFKDKYVEINEQLLLVKNEYDNLDRYRQYGPISEIDFSDLRRAFADFCGCESQYAGYLHECMLKLLQYDRGGVEYIDEQDFATRIEELETRMCEIVVAQNPGTQAEKYLDDIDKFQSVYEAEKAQEVLAKDINEWTVYDTVRVANYYKRCVEEEDAEGLEAFYKPLKKSKKIILQSYEMNDAVFDGEEYDEYIAYVDPTKTYYILTFLSGMGYSDTEGFNSLKESFTTPAACAVKKNAAAPKFNYTVTNIDQGLVVTCTTKETSEVRVTNPYQNIIFRQQGLTLQEKYDSIDKVEEGVKIYRGRIKQIKDAQRLEVLETAKEKGTSIGDLKVDASYEALHESDDKKMYELITNMEDAKMFVESNADLHVEFNMTEDEIETYSYLYSLDSKNNTAFADEYLLLLRPQLSYRAGEACFEPVKDIILGKALMEVGIGVSNVGAGLQNAMGLNDDRDGVAITTAAQYQNQMIMESAESEGEKKLYAGAQMVGTAIPGVVVTASTSGVGAPAVVGTMGTATLYGVSDGGNAMAAAEQAGYTESTAVEYGIISGVESGVKVAAMSGIARTGGLKTDIPLPITTAGATLGGGGIEFFDETVVNPAAKYHILDDTNAFNEVDYEAALENASLAGIMVGAGHFFEGARNGKLYNSNLDGINVKTNVVTPIDEALPNVENAYINPKKLTAYALNPEHPVGGNKAKVFESALGYNLSNWEELMSQVYDKLPVTEAELGTLDSYGQRYTVDMPITGPNGNTVNVRTGWIIRGGSEIPELTSIYVKN